MPNLKPNPSTAPISGVEQIRAMTAARLAKGSAGPLADAAGIRPEDLSGFANNDIVAVPIEVLDALVRDLTGGARAYDPKTDSVVKTASLHPVMMFKRLQHTIPRATMVDGQLVQPVHGGLVLVRPANPDAPELGPTVYKSGTLKAPDPKPPRRPST